ncbi:MAG: EAL domain-containing protein [gamma proteobacterium symbiont of Taylorina sp.]|nr:EAL domain-containing protein [gamma proteobacterium symbiont of Taylorina sp.]
MKNKPTYEELLKKNQLLELKLIHQKSNSTSQSIDMLCIASIDGYFTQVNTDFKTTLGYSEEELTKHPYLYFIHPDDLESTKAAMKQLSSGQSVINFKIRYRCHDGSYKWFHWTSIPIISENLTYAIAINITEQKQTNEELQKNHFYLESIFRASPTGIGLVKDRMLKEVNEKVCQITGYSREELIDNSSRMLYPSDEAYDFVGQEKYRQIQKNGTGTVETQFKCKDGHIIDILLSSTPLDINNFSKGVTFTLLDISERKLKERELKEKNKFIQMVIDGITDVVIVINSDYSISMMNLSAQALIDKSFIKDINSPKCYEVSHHFSSPCSGNHYPCPLQQVLRSHRTHTVIHHHVIGVDKARQLELTASPLKGDNGKVYAIIESIHDITMLLQAQKELNESSLALDHLAHHDELTKLPNRLLFSDRLNQKIKFAYRNKKKVALLIIDLDNFKKINDSLGHAVGDIILKETAQRLQHCVCDTDTVARLGGDEFSIIMDDIEDNDTVTEIVTKIIQDLQEVFTFADHKLYVTSSIGISIYPSDAESVEDLLRNADSAMYKAKDNGRNTYQYYTEDMTQKAFEHILMESSLRHALQNNELTVYYQPQVNAKHNQIVGMEALVRWQHPELGIISPAKFIPLAEKTGLILQLGEQVFDIATKQMVIWMKDYQLDGNMSINLSGKQFQQPQLVEVLSDKLQENGCKPEWIELEITENHVMDNPEQAIIILQKFQDMGINIAVDDFGTGYSSLSYLKRLPINKLKIDQSFVQDIETDEDDRVIINSTISLAKNMNLSVIAEGVETKVQKNFLLEQKCELIQGYYYCRPVAADEMTELLNSYDWKNL